MCVNAPEYLEAFFAAQKLGCGAGERELPLRRRRARVPARQLRRGRARVPRRLRADRRRRARHAARRPPAARAAPGRARRRRRAARRRARLRATRSRRRRRRAADRSRTVGRRPRLPLHRRHHRLPEGRHVAQRRPLRVAVADGAARAPSRPTSRPRCAPSKRAATLPARVPAHARHRPVHRAVDARRAAAPSCCSTRRASTPTRCGTRSSASTCRCARSSATRSRARCSPRSTPTPDRWDLSGAARDHVVGRHVEPGDEARAARAPAARHADRLARRVGRDHDAHRDARRRRHRAGAVQGERTASWSSPTTATSCSPATSAIGMLGVGGADPARLLQGPREDRGDVPHRRAAAATRSPATTRPSTPTARSGCSAAARRASTPAARRCTPKRSSSRCASHPDVFDCVVVGVPDDRWGEMVVALVQPRDGRHDRRRRARRALPRDARRRTRCRSSIVASTRSSVRRPAKPTTNCCARSRAEERYRT